MKHPHPWCRKCRPGVYRRLLRVRNEQIEDRLGKPIESIRRQVIKRWTAGESRDSIALTLGINVGRVNLWVTEAYWASKRKRQRA